MSLTTSHIPTESAHVWVLFYSYTDIILGVFDSELKAKAAAYDIMKRSSREETPSLVELILNEHEGK